MKAEIKTGWRWRWLWYNNGDHDDDEEDNDDDEEEEEDNDDGVVVPEAAVSWSGPISPTLLANFSGGEIEDRVSLLNTMISLDTSTWKQVEYKQTCTTNKYNKHTNTKEYNNNMSTRKNNYKQ